MTAATILMILNIVGALFEVITEAPSVIEEIASLMTKVSPFVDETNAEVKRAFEAAQERLQEIGK